MFELHYWPLLTVLWCVLSLTTTYILALTQKHVYYLLPYISDTGALPPESCVFGQMFNITALLMTITIYIRHRQIEIYHNLFGTQYPRYLQLSTFVLGLVSSFGISLVANFQENTLHSVHIVGAVCAFGVGAIYFSLQAVYTFLFMKKIRDGVRVVPKWIFYCRVVLSFFMILFFVTEFVFDHLAKRDSNSKEVFAKKLLWSAKNRGYTPHLFSTFSEWLLVICELLYLLTFVKEFKYLKFGGIIIVTTLTEET